MIKLVTGDEIIEELQGIINVSNKITKKHTPDDKENLSDFVKMRHIEGRLTEVVKENETLIDELQDKKFEVYKLKNKIDARKEVFEEVGGVIEDKVSDFLKRMGMSKKNITALQNLVKDTMEEFRLKISSDNESEGEMYHPTLKKSESYQPLTGRNPVQKQGWDSDESEETSKSNQKVYKSNISNQFVENRGKTMGKSAIKGTPNVTMNKSFLVLCSIIDSFV